MTDRLEVLVVGAGQAGLAVSRELSEAGVAHTVLEKGQVGQTWRGRWESFCLVTPNWSMQLPGQPYDGDDPDSFDPRDEIVQFLERYAAAFEVPVREGVEVKSLQPLPDGGFLLETSAGSLEAGTVVLSTGAYQRPHRPPRAATLPALSPCRGAAGRRGGGGPTAAGCRRRGGDRRGDRPRGAGARRPVGAGGATPGRARRGGTG